MFSTKQFCERNFMFYVVFVVAYVDKLNKKGKLDEKTQLFGKQNFRRKLNFYYIKGILLFKSMGGDYYYFVIYY